MHPQTLDDTCFDSIKVTNQPNRFALISVIAFLSIGFNVSDSCAQVSASRTQGCTDYTFECLYPAFLKLQVKQAYAEYESPTTPAEYDAANGDYRAQFASPSGKIVKIVVKAPVTSQEYDVPRIRADETAYEYLNAALYISPNIPRQRTVINFPKDTYDFNFPLFSNCTSPTDHQPKYVHWQVAGASDLVIDGHGSTVNFSDFCLGLNLANVNRVTVRNFTFAWPHIRIASVASIVAVGGNGTTGYTYDVKIAAAYAANLPKMLSATTAWDKSADHWDLQNPNDDVSYGDGIDSGTPLQCAETVEERKVSGCTAKNIPSYGVQFKVGESVLLHYYSFATALSASGNDITFDHITFKNLIGSDFTYSQGRGLHVTHVVLTRMSNQPISGGGGSLLTNVSGDVVFDNSSFSYQSDDAFDMNTTIVRFTPVPVANSTPMNTLTFNLSTPHLLPWPAANLVQPGDVIGLFDNGLTFKSVATVESVSSPANGANPVLTLDRAVSSDLGQAGFIAGDLSASAGARYLFSNNVFAFNRGRALLLQTPYGWVNENRFVGQTFKEVYALASQYWGEGPGAQELVLSKNQFDATGQNYLSGFFALDIMAEAANFPNFQNEVAGAGSPSPPVNQNIIVADNTFTTDRPQAIVNVSSANDVVFTNSSFNLKVQSTQDAVAAADWPGGSDRGPRQFPVTIHDASNIFFGITDTYTSRLPDTSCADSIMLQLSDPPPKISPFAPIACKIAATTSELIFDRR
jgi:hypothetical protein